MARLTSSLWGKPPSRYYALLRRAESSKRGGRPHLAVLGCSDGKFVLPTARGGFTVMALAPILAQRIQPRFVVQVMRTRNAVVDLATTGLGLRGCRLDV